MYIFVGGILFCAAVMITTMLFNGIMDMDRNIRYSNEVVTDINEEYRVR